MSSFNPSSRLPPTVVPNVDKTKVPSPEYLNTLSPFIRANIHIPTPLEHDPEWTSKNNTFPNTLPSFPSLITLPSPSANPAYYAAAADTIRISNWRFNQHGPYTQVLLPAHVSKLASAWRAQFPSSTQYPFPPDLRTLYVKADDKHPAEDGHPLWTQACEEFAAMADFEKPGFLRKTRAQHIRENELEGRGVAQEEKLYLRIFKRYLVWKEHVERAGERADQQPTRQEMQGLFAKREVVEKGVSLADICHVFPEAKDVEMLVYRVEREAVYTSRPGEEGEPVEGVYMPRPMLAEEEIEEEAVEGSEPGPIFDEQLLERMHHMVDRYPAELARLLDEVAVWDSDAGRYMKKNEAPTAIPPPSPTEVGTPPPSPPKGKGKRKRAEDELEQPSKKTKRQAEEDGDTVLVRCNGTTQQRRQCRKKQRRPRGETYNCGKHR